MTTKENLSRVSLVVSLLLCANPAAPQIPGVLGPVVPVNALTDRPHSRGTVAFDGASHLLFAFGRFQNPGQVGTQDWDIPVRTFSTSLSPGPVEVLANEVTFSAQAWPRLAFAGGQYLVGWESYLEQPGDSSEESIRARFVSTSGAPQGSAFQVNTFGAGPQRYLDIAGTPDGGFVVVWQSLGSGGSDQSDTSVQGQRLDSSGQPIGAEFQVNTTTSGGQRFPRVASLWDGSFAVVWGDIATSTARGRFYDPAGLPLGDDLALAVGPEDASGYFPAIAGEKRMPRAGESPRYFVAWSAFTPPPLGPSGVGDAWDVRARQFTGTGVPLADPFFVNSPAAADQWQPEVAMDCNGSVLVAWSDALAPTRAKVRPFAPDGVPLAPEMEILEAGHASQRLRGVTDAGGGLFVVTWTEEAAPERVFARRFFVALVFQGDFEGGDTSAWSSALP